MQFETTSVSERIPLHGRSSIPARMLVWMVAVLASTLLPMGAHASTTYNTSVGFSPGVNPTANGIWAYGWTASQMETDLHLYTLPTVDPAGNSVWNASGSQVEGVVAMNRTHSPISYVGYTFPSGAFFFHPGSGAQWSTVRWTAPASGTAHVVAQFKQTQLSGNPAPTVELAIVAKVSPLASPSVQWHGGLNAFGGGSSASTSFTIPVAAGATLDFKSGNAGDWFYDGALINATVTFTASGPSSPPPLTVRPTYYSTLGTAGTLAGEFNHPWGVATDASGNVFVCDYDNNRVQKFSSTGQLLRVYAGYKPTDVAADADGDIYVTDAQFNRVVKYPSSGGGILLTFGSSGSGDGQFNFPQAIAMDADGFLYVADTGNNRIQKFTAAGAYVSQWRAIESPREPLHQPNGLAVDHLGHVYVADADGASNLRRVTKFMSDGTYVLEWGSQGTAPGQIGWPGGLDVDAAGKVWLADDGNSRVQVFSPEGEFMLAFGVAGSGAGQLLNPVGVDIAPNGDIYVSEWTNSRVQRFRPILTGAIFPTGPFGISQVAVSSDGTLFVSGADPTGTSGVDIQLDNVTAGTGIRVNLDPPDLDPPDFDPPALDPPDFDPPDSPVRGLTTRFIGSASGVAGTVLGSVRIYSDTPVLGFTSGPRGPNGASTATAATLVRYEITPDFSGLGSLSYRAEIYLNGALVATYPGHTGVIGADSVRTTIEDLGSAFTEDLLLTFRDNNTFTINPSTVVAGDQLRLVAEGVFATVDDRSRIELRGEGDSTSGFRILNVATVPSLLGVPRVPGTPTAGFALRSVWPNPSHGQTTLRMSVPAQGRVSMGVFDLAGRNVRSLASGMRQAGVHTMSWDGRDAGGREAPAGIYFVRGQFESGALRTQVVSGRFVLIR